MLIIDRYILKSFVSTLFFSIIALCVIFLIVNLLENLDSFLDQNAKWEVIARYYLYYFPEIIKLLVPVATLLATLFSIGRLSNLNEITAMKSGGLSLYRLMLPLLIFTIILSFSQLYFNGWVVPEANAKKHEIEQKYMSRSRTGEMIYNLYFRDRPRVNVVMQYYNSRARSGTRVSIEYFSDNDSPRLEKRIEAESIYWDTASAGWILRNAISRDYGQNTVSASEHNKLPVELKITHEQIKQIKRSTDEMSFTELRDYIELLEQGGKDVRLQLIDYHGQLAFPFANLIVILFGVPFASVKKKGGIAIQIGAAMVISFTYMIFTKVSQTLAYAANFDEILAGWSANIIFFAAGLITIIKTKT
jgi:lipopolysaccharide export system permease protein